MVRQRWLVLFALGLSGCETLEHFPRDEFPATRIVAQDCRASLPRRYAYANYQETLLNLGKPTHSDILPNGRIIIDYDKVDSANLDLCDKQKPYVFTKLHFEFDAEGMPLKPPQGGNG